MSEIGPYRFKPGKHHRDADERLCRRSAPPGERGEAGEGGIVAQRAAPCGRPGLRECARLSVHVVSAARLVLDAQVEPRLQLVRRRVGVGLRIAHRTRGSVSDGTWSPSRRLFDLRECLVSTGRLYFEPKRTFVDVQIFASHETKISQIALRESSQSIADLSLRRRAIRPGGIVRLLASNQGNYCSLAKAIPGVSNSGGHRAAVFVFHQ